MFVVVVSTLRFPSNKLTHMYMSCFLEFIIVSPSILYKYPEIYNAKCSIYGEKKFCKKEKMNKKESE